MKKHYKTLSRVGRLSWAYHVVRQLNQLGMPATAYTVANWMGVSAPTARNILKKLAENLNLSEHEREHRPSVMKKVYYQVRSDGLMSYEEIRSRLDEVTKNEK